MMIQQDVSLMPFNSFGIDVHAKYFASFSSEVELLRILKENDQTISESTFLFIGSGSNILFTQDFNGLVLKNEIQGMAIVHEDEEFRYVTAGAGVLWNDFVGFCIDNNLGGIENLSLIPGTVGAAPIQNIGAYGVELKDVLHAVKLLDLHERQWIVFNNTNPIIGKRHEFIVSKTGYIRASGGCIAMMLDTDVGRRVVIVLGSKNTHTRIPEAEFIATKF